MLYIIYSSLEVAFSVLVASPSLLLQVLCLVFRLEEYLIHLGVLFFLSLSDIQYPIFFLESLTLLLVNSLGSYYTDFVILHSFPSFPFSPHLQNVLIYFTYWEIRSHTNYSCLRDPLCHLYLLLPFFSPLLLLATVLKVIVRLWHRVFWYFFPW